MKLGRSLYCRWTSSVVENQGPILCPLESYYNLAPLIKYKQEEARTQLLRPSAGEQVSRRGLFMSVSVRARPYLHENLSLPGLHMNLWYSFQQQHYISFYSMLPIPSDGIMEFEFVPGKPHIFMSMCCEFPRLFTVVLCCVFLWTVITSLLAHYC